MEGRWVTINGAKVFINDKGDVIMGLGKKYEANDSDEKLKKYLTSDFSVEEAKGWPSDWKWTPTMRTLTTEYRKETFQQAKQMADDFIEDVRNGRAEPADIDKFVGYSGRLNIESKKIFRETIGAKNWRRKVGDNYCAYIALYNNTAKHFEKEYKRSLKFGDPLSTVVRNRMAANFASNYAKQMSKILEDWDKGKDY